MNITESLYCNTVILYHETTANHTTIESDNFKYIINITYPSVLVGRKKHNCWAILCTTYYRFLISTHIQSHPKVRRNKYQTWMWPILEGTASSLFVLETKRNPIQTDSLFCFFLNCAWRRKERHMDWPSPNQSSCMFVHKYHPSVGQSFMTWTIHFSNYFQHSGQTLKNEWLFCTCRPTKSRTHYKQDKCVLHLVNN